MFGVANQNQQSISQLVELPEHRVVEECATPMARTMYRKTQKSKLIQKFSFQPVHHIQEQYIALIDMGKIIRHKVAPLTSGLTMS